MAEQVLLLFYPISILSFFFPDMTWILIRPANVPRSKYITPYTVLQMAEVTGLRMASEISLRPTEGSFWKFLLS